MRKTIACDWHSTGGVLLSIKALIGEIITSYRFPYQHMLMYRNEDQSYADIEQGNSQEQDLTMLLFKHFPASNPKFFIGSFFMNTFGVIVQVCVTIFLSKNTENDSDASGIVTTLPKSKADIATCATLLVVKDMLLNMIEIGLTQKAALSRSCLDNSSVISFAGMRLANALRFPNYLHNQKTITKIADMTVHATSMLANISFLENITESLIMLPKMRELNGEQKQMAALSNGMFAVGSLGIFLMSMLNIIAIMEPKLKLPIHLATIIGTLRMMLFVGGNYSGRCLAQNTIEA